MNKRLALIPVTVAAAAALAACGSSSTKAAPSDTDAAAGSSGCPTAAPAADVKPEWTVTGKTGSAEVTGSTDTAAPKVTVKGPFTVAETQVHTLKTGTGAVVGANASVSVCYMGVNGRDGNVFDSAYQRGAPADFSLNGVVPGFSKAIAGQKVGSTVAVAMVPADGYPQGQPDAGIQPTDTLIFAIKILSANS
ncbi:FKBP-type peptidyl-prolyl cis-trans isomerase [Tsukamurella sp. 8F]|uniref:FKBP-type peptidyl-prolyl cis-trans isomerase n=1 Tax=unclassified Tsukamurella TaxID=2633480 RepID=UPI0023B90F99|nr:MULTISPECIES: FKBP-type peptidyl-prolyl cis-trans isomerase [unclassified Tsukamurella]MDF0529935.1 FKBP-type peptidyl-prolyl cis-trans isomerase [Tsukamurella sp. 8J]MDF0587293.1 FKBP-type peptidyl-prolyl cis-trans isomerase [Tsukamurella sp. 8F]